MPDLRHCAANKCSEGEMMVQRPLAMTLPGTWMTRWQPLGFEDGVVDSVDQYRISKNYFRLGFSVGHVQEQGNLSLDDLASMQGNKGHSA
jgi:hypothetical protein